MRTIATMREDDTGGDARGVVRVEDVFDTDIDDLWAACTEPERLARWIAEVSGDLLVGGTVHAVFTSSWAGSSRVDACEAPTHLLLTTVSEADEGGQTEVWLRAEGSRTRLVVEERGLPVGALHFYGAGWQAHLEDLHRSLAIEGRVHGDGWSADRPATAWHDRWAELTAAYERR